MIHLYYGDGKGTTTAAIGLSVRAAGAGATVVLAQFLKGSYTSELKSLSNISEITVVRSDEPIPFYSQMTEEDKRRVRRIHDGILEKVLELVASVGQKKEEESEERTCRLLIVLDEITYPLNWGLVDPKLVDKILDMSSEETEVVMTGRDPSEYLIGRGDYVTEMMCHKHPYDQGLQARRGVEY